jgi:hypothetical protein
MPCGQSVGVVKRIESLSEVFFELVGEAEELSKRLGNFFGGGEG